MEGCRFVEREEGERDAGDQPERAAPIVEERERDADRAGARKGEKHRVEPRFDVVVTIDVEQAVTIRQDPSLHDVRRDEEQSADGGECHDQQIGARKCLLARLLGP